MEHVPWELKFGAFSVWVFAKEFGYQMHVLVYVVLYIE